MSAFDVNLENEIKASLQLSESGNTKVLIVAVYSQPSKEPGVEREGGLCRAVSSNVTVKDARAFVAGLEREIERIKGLAGL